ncbi:pyruvate dehydrogenase (E1 subunit beta), partial [Bacillus inaquosorum]|nr:pyruvate dehydrogenase (E1 subunit beta) [Bacillus inaquosorum]
PDTVFPFSQAESVWLPNHKDVLETARKVLEF